jgi:uncharacterized delta-60 repeat protein
MQEEVISFNITNTTNGNIPLSLMGNNTDIMDNSNATTRYFWDLTGFSLTNEDTITIQYQFVGSSITQTASVTFTPTNLQSVADALNTLNIGAFFITTSGGSTYLNNYNRYVIFSTLDISSSTSAGIINTSFVVGTGFNMDTYCLDKQSDGKIVVGGQFADYNLIGANYIIRLNTDGSVDGTFSSGTGFDNSVLTIAVQTDGKIIVGGNFTSYNGTGANYIIRLNSNGSVDGTFVIGTGFNDPVYDLAIQSDGKILVCGQFTSYNGTGANRIIRLNTNGSIDGTFVYGTGFDGFTVWKIALQSDGKILIGGDFTTYNGTSANYIIRLNTNGSVDGTFVYGTGFDFGATRSISIQSDGKIVCGGDFTSYNGTSANNIIRLNTDGSIDGSFVYGTGFNGALEDIAIQTDGKIVCGGQFTTYQGTSANYIIRLNTDGSIDSTFVYGTGFSSFGFVKGISLSTTKMYLVGYFTTFQSLSYNYIISLNQ